MATMATSSDVSSAQTADHSQYNNLRHDALAMAGDYATTTGSANAYVLAIDATISSLVVGMKLRWKANFTNTSACTINPNSLGALPIKKFGTQDLAPGDIVVNLDYSGTYDGTNIQLDGNGTTSQYQTTQITLGESVSAGDALYISDGNEGNVIDYYGTSGTTGNGSGAGYWFGQLFTTLSDTTAIKNVWVRFGTNATTLGGLTGTISVSIRAVSGGVPTGADLGSGAATIADSTISTGNYQYLNLVFGTPITVSASTTYAIIIRDSMGGGTNIYTPYASVGSGGGLVTSSNSGSTWAADTTKNLTCIIMDTIGRTAGRYYKTKASVLDARNFPTAFALESGTAGQVKTVVIGGIIPTTGLTAGSDYYVSNTAGAIATSAGTYGKKLGRAISTTQLFFQPELGAVEIFRPLSTYVSVSGPSINANFPSTYLKYDLTASVYGIPFRVKRIFLQSDTSSHDLTIQAGDGTDSYGGTFNSLPRIMAVDQYNMVQQSSPGGFGQSPAGWTLIGYYF